MTFLDRFVKRVVGVKSHEDWAGKQLLSNWLMVSNEAFALLVHENQEERWKSLRKDPDKKMPGKFTDGGGAKDLDKSGRNRKHRGWSNEGIRRCNDLFNKIEFERTTPERKKFEVECLQKKIKESMKKNKSTKKIYDDDGDAPVHAKNEMHKQVMCALPTLHVPRHATTGTFGIHQGEQDPLMQVATMIEQSEIFNETQHLPQETNSIHKTMKMKMKMLLFIKCEAISASFWMSAQCHWV